MRETKPLAGKPVEVRCLDHRVAGTAQRVVPPIIREQDEDIGPRRFSGASGRHIRDEEAEASAGNEAQEDVEGGLAVHGRIPDRGIEWLLWSCCQSYRCYHVKSQDF